jgi:hypothetical protein
VLPLVRAAHKAGLAACRSQRRKASCRANRIIDVDGKATDDVAKLLARLDDRKVGDVGGLVSGTGRQIARGACGAATRELLKLNLWIRR